MKKYVFLLACIAFSISVSAQNEDNDSIRIQTEESKSFIYLDSLNTDLMFSWDKKRKSGKENAVEEHYTVALAKMSRFVQNINTFNQLIPREKAYIHFDNTGYYLGETIWFKAYVVSALSFLPTDQSRVLYVELLNPKGKVLETKKLKIEDGQCNGEFYLSTSNFEYLLGLYEIRAYTKTMLNFGEETVFSRVFPVFEKPETEGDYTNTDMRNGEEENFLKNYRTKSEKMDKVDVTFYPEGGSSVKGLLSTVAFKVTDNEGQNLEVTGDVYSADGNRFATFSTKYGGMGTFEYIPDGKKNKVKIQYEGKEYSFDLPQALPGGYVIKVNNFQKQNLILQVTKSLDLPTIPLGVSILCRGQVFFFDMVEPGGEPAVLKIPKETLPIGTNQITLFDAKGEVYAERLVFISPEEAELAKIKAVPDKENYTANERITIDFSVSGKTASAHNSFSVAVRDASLKPDTPDAGSIATNFLLSSDLKGFIENPSYYFESNDAARIQALDLLMLVQGWRQYEWKQMAGIEPFTQSFDTEKGLVVKGLLKGTAKEINIVMLKDTLYMEDTVVPDNKGVFYDYPEDFYGTWTLSIRPVGEDFEDAYKNVRLDRWFSPEPRSYSFYEKKSIYDMGVKKKDKKRGKYRIYDVARDIDRAIDLGRKFWFGNVHDIFDISPWDAPRSSGSFSSIPPEYVKSYVNFTMRMIPSVRYTTFDGYSKAKNFYVNKSGREEYIPTAYEHSRTLYWNPDVKTDNQGKAQISFYNNAQCKKINISAEGISKEGMPIAID